MDRAIEVEWLLLDLKSVGSLPPHTQLWAVLSQRWGIEQIPGVYKKRILQNVYELDRTGKPP